ncbi:MAG: helix-turn-helix transcriptional regulator [Victivallales bacterium]|nr:helix-turn-helix transcriptional regulator [Victivallales bacterium]
MFNFTINSIGVYRNKERYRQTIHCPWLDINLSGLVYSRVRTPDDRLIFSSAKDDAYLRLGLPGMITDFEYGERRENWVVMFGEIPMRYSPSPKSLQLKDGTAWVEIPVSADLPKTSLPAIRTDLLVLQECFRNPLPVNRLRAKLIVAGFLEFLMGKRHYALNETPAAELKRLIDEDVEFKRTLAELSAKCAYSTDHLRVLFNKEFGISPKEYPHQKRMSKIMEYISGTRMSIKEIAEVTGFEHPSHFSMAFRKAFGTTPSEAIGKYRHQKPATTI